jgi:hypothetical protein
LGLAISNSVYVVSKRLKIVNIHIKPGIFFFGKEHKNTNARGGIYVQYKRPRFKFDFVTPLKPLILVTRFTDEEMAVLADSMKMFVGCFPGISRVFRMMNMKCCLGVCA